MSATEIIIEMITILLFGVSVGLLIGRRRK